MPESAAQMRLHVHFQAFITDTCLMCYYGFCDNSHKVRRVFVAFGVLSAGCVC